MREGVRVRRSPSRCRDLPCRCRRPRPVDIGVDRAAEPTTRPLSRIPRRGGGLRGGRSPRRVPSARRHGGARAPPSTLIRSGEPRSPATAAPKHSTSWSTTTPFTPSTTVSRTPPSATATTGSPVALASSGANPRGSRTGAYRNRSASRYAVISAASLTAWRSSNTIPASSAARSTCARHRSSTWFATQTNRETSGPAAATASTRKSGFLESTSAPTDSTVPCTWRGRSCQAKRSMSTPGGHTRDTRPYARNAASRVNAEFTSSSSNERTQSVWSRTSMRRPSTRANSATNRRTVDTPIRPRDPRPATQGKSNPASKRRRSGSWRYSTDGSSSDRATADGRNMSPVWAITTSGRSRTISRAHAAQCSANASRSTRRRLHASTSSPRAPRGRGTSYGSTRLERSPASTACAPGGDHTCTS